MNRLTTPYRTLSPSSRRVFWIVAAIAGLLTVLSLTLIESLLKSATLLDILGVSIPMVLALVTIISAISIFYNRVRFGAWLFFASTVAAMLALPFVQQGIAFPAAVLVMVVTVLIPLQIASGRSATGATVIGFVVAGAIIAIDTFWTGKRAGITSQDLQATRIATGGLAIILFISVASLYRSFNLRTKLLLLSLGASLLSVIAVAWAASYYTEATLSQNARENLLTAASHTAESLDSYISFNVNLIKSEAALPIFRQYLLGSETGRNILWVELQSTMRTFAQRDSQNIGSYALLDKNGVDVWDSYLRDVGLDKSDRDYFTNPFTTGKTESPSRENDFVLGRSGQWNLRQCST